MKNKSKKSILTELLLALVPYTRQNLMLVFKPNQFFDELECLTNYSRKQIQNTYYRVKKEKMVSFDNKKIDLSLRARQIVQPFIAEKLSNDAQLMVIFDIPEEFAGRRQRFRNLLKTLEFKQIQYSVWMSNMDHREIIKESIAEIELEDWVQIYEAVKL